MREYYFDRPGKWSDKRNWRNGIKPRWWHRPGNVFIEADCLLDCNTPRLIAVEQISDFTLVAKPRKWFGLFRRATILRAHVIAAVNKGKGRIIFVHNTTGDLIIEGSITSRELLDACASHDRVWSPEYGSAYGHRPVDPKRNIKIDGEIIGGSGENMDIFTD